MKTPLLIITAALGLLGPSAAQAQQTGFQIIVHADNPVTSITAADVSGMFQKKVTSWSNGRSVVPFDLDGDSQVRERFSRTVHRRSAGAIKAYWQRQIFAGRGVPPVERNSDAEVLASVAADPGAIGYVSSGASLGRNVKVVGLVDSTR